MKVVVAGGTGLIGSQVVSLLKEAGHEAVPASPSTGVNTLTGEGLDAVLQGADVVVDLTNRLVFEKDEVVSFFSESTRNLLAAEEKAGVKHHFALSIVGMDRMPDVSYMAGKVAQERIIRDGTVPYTILRATQFFEFLPSIAEGNDRDGTIHVTDHLMQPIAATDVATTVAQLAVQPPLNGFADLAGPERAPMHTFASRYLAARGDTREVVADPGAGYFGIPISHDTLVPAGEAYIGSTNLTTWLEA